MLTETPGQGSGGAGEGRACLSFTGVVKYGEDEAPGACTRNPHANMKPKKGEGKKMKALGAAQVRATISFPPDLYGALAELAKQKKVSLAWVVREAAERYVADLAAETTRPRADTPEAAR